MQNDRAAVSEPSSTRNGLKRKQDRAASAAAPTVKRIRVSRACDQCRAGREKCNGVQPTCQSCENQKRSCTYNEQPKKRGIQPNYIRTLEMTLAWTFQTFPRSEARLRELLPDLKDDVHRSIAGKDAAKSEALHKSWRNSLVSRQIDQLLSGATIEAGEALPVDEAADLTVDHSTSHTGPTPSMIDTVNDMPLESMTSTTLLNDDAPFSTTNLSATVSASQLLQLPDSAWSLLEHYFAFTHSWLPITEKHDILKLMYKYPSEGLPMAAASNGDHAELWSLMALSASQRSGDLELGEMEYLVSTSKALIPIPHGPFELSHVKALLIQSLLDVQKEDWLAAWITAGAAVRILTYLSSDMGQSKLLQLGRARHTCLAAFVLESAIAFRIGAQTHLRAAIIVEIGLPIEDGIEEWSPWKDPSTEGSVTAKSPIMAISAFNKLVKMTERLHDRGSSGMKSHYNRFVTIDIILKLAQNASFEGDRKQPSILIADMLNTPVMENPAQSKGSYPGPGTIMSPPNTNTWASQSHFAQSSAYREQTPFLSIPNASSDSAPGSTPAQFDPRIESPGQLSVANSYSAQIPTQDLSLEFESGSLFNADIFDELASLERTDSSSARPQFMQNLGFGPDLDLAEFFGADYQASDPMLAYIQT